MKAIIEEVEKLREIRKRISQAYGNDVQRLAAHYRQWTSEGQSAKNDENQVRNSADVCTKEESGGDAGQN